MVTRFVDVIWIALEEELMSAGHDRIQRVLGRSADSPATGAKPAGITHNRARAGVDLHRIAITNVRAAKGKRDICRMDALELNFKTVCHLPCIVDRIEVAQGAEERGGRSLMAEERECNDGRDDA